MRLRLLSVITKTVISQKLINLCLNSTKILNLQFANILFSTKNIPHIAEYKKHHKNFYTEFFSISIERI